MATITRTSRPQTAPPRAPRRPALRALAGLVACAMATSVMAFGAAPAGAASEPSEMRFPVNSDDVRYSNDWGNARSGGRGHEGTDIMAPKLTPALAIVSGEITKIKDCDCGLAGNYIELTGEDGWMYRYVHMNNDTPGTDDGRNPREWLLMPGIEVGAQVIAGQPISFVGDSGNAEGTGPHIHFEAHRPGGGAVNPYPILTKAATADRPNIRQVVDNPQGGRYALLDDGRVVALEGAPFLGEPSFGWNIARDIVVAESGRGYAVVDGWGGIHVYGEVPTFERDVVWSWPSKDVIESIEISADGEGYILTDIFGTVHPVMPLLDAAPGVGLNFRPSEAAIAQVLGVDVAVDSDGGDVESVDDVDAAPAEAVVAGAVQDAPVFVYPVVEATYVDGDEDADVAEELTAEELHAVLLAAAEIDEVLRMAVVAELVNPDRTRVVALADLPEVWSLPSTLIATAGRHRLAKLLPAPAPGA